MEKELTLQEIQQASLKVLLKVKEVCEKYDIKYFLAYGTLIGAVRHKGFIPWDDDIDVILLRKDYERLINLLIEKPDLIAPFELLHYRTNKKYIYTIARVSDPSYRIEYDNTKEYGLGIFIDLFPLDKKYPDNKKVLKKQIRRNDWIFQAGLRRYRKASSFVRNIPKLAAFIISRSLNLNKLLKKNDLKAQKFNNSNSIYCGAQIDNPRTTMLLEHFNETTQLMFEGHLFSCPAKYDEHLTDVYGDYMKLPPENERIGHHFYSAYKKQ